MNIRDYIEHLKSKPEHVRQRIALGSSVGVTAFVALFWGVALVSSGDLALTPSDTSATREVTAAATETKNSFSNLLGAASAFQSGTQGASSVTVVGERASSTLDDTNTSTEGKTVIPF